MNVFWPLRTCRRLVVVGAMLIVAAEPASASIVTNLYRMNRVFEAITTTVQGAATAYKVHKLSGELTEVVKGQDVQVMTNLTAAHEYEGFAWGYDTA